MSLQWGFIKVATSSSTFSASGAMRFTFASTVEMPPALVSYFVAYSLTFSSGMSASRPCFATWFFQMATRCAPFRRSKQME